MTRKGPLLVLLWLLLVVACTPSAGPSQGQGSYSNAQLLVETNWLAQHVDDPNIRVVDVRDAPNYQAGHIKTALHLNVGDLTDEQASVRGMLAPQARLEAVLGSLGIGREATVVAYDDSGGLWAARLFWALDYYQHKDVRILNGGFSQWVKEGRSLSREVPKVETVQYQGVASPERLATREWIVQNLGNSSLVLVDARTPDEYKGSDVRSKRGGHLPGAVNIEWGRNLDQGVWKGASELQAMYQEAGVTQGKEVVTYCQTGVRAAHDYFTLRLLGYPRVRVYDGSWEEWGNDPSLPGETS